MGLSNKTYDIVKRLVQVVLPAASSLYFGLASIWELPNAEKVVGTIAVITTFLGVSLGISSAKYVAGESEEDVYDGSLVVQTSEEGTKVYSLELNSDPGDLEDRSVISFLVKVA